MSEDAERIDRLTDVLLQYALTAQARDVIVEEARHLDAAWCFASESIKPEPRPSRAKRKATVPVCQPDVATIEELLQTLACHEMIARGDLVPATEDNTPKARRPLEDGADFAMTRTVELFERLTGRRAARATTWTDSGSYASGRTLAFCRSVESVYGAGLGIATEDRIRKVNKERRGE